MNIAVWEQLNDDEEPQASALSPEDREFVIGKLVEMLVNDYQQHEENQAVIAPTVKESPVFYRGARTRWPDRSGDRRYFEG